MSQITKEYLCGLSIKEELRLQEIWTERLIDKATERVIPIFV